MVPKQHFKLRDNYPPQLAHSEGFHNLPLDGAKNKFQIEQQFCIYCISQNLNLLYLFHPTAHHPPAPPPPPEPNMSRWWRKWWMVR